MKTQEARQLGSKISQLIAENQNERAFEVLLPILSIRIPFRILDVIGGSIGEARLEIIDGFLDRVASARTMGGWVVIASALRQQLFSDMSGSINRSRKYAIAADVWYAADSIAERVLGPALVVDFELASALLSGWRVDPNRWVRRMVGVAAHNWAKRTRGAELFKSQVTLILGLLDPLFSEQDIDVVKGIGWGLKTLGRYYPDMLAEWLVRQAGRPHKKLIIRKATTYLPDEMRNPIFAELR